MIKALVDRSMAEIKQSMARTVPAAAPGPLPRLISLFCFLSLVNIDRSLGLARAPSLRLRCCDAVLATCVSGVTEHAFPVLATHFVFRCARALCCPF